MSTSAPEPTVGTTSTTPLAVPAAPEISVVLPCLNEADTLGTCIAKAQTAFAEHGLDGEVVVADNGSTDGSIEIAESMGARVVHVETKGYGAALTGGIRAAAGTYVIMADADDSYDLLELPKFVEKLREGYDLVQGCRLERGGGRVMPGAMPFLHRRWGNPMFSAMARSWFRSPLTDVYCGFRGFTKSFWLDLRQRADGMEFATEMTIKASQHRANIGEVPITLHRDGRVAHAPHLRTFRDGWRTLRFFLLYSPRWLFFTPGLLLMLVGVIGYGVVLSHTVIGKLHFDAHSLLFASLFIIMGYQAVLFAVSAWTFATAEGLMPMTKNLKGWFGLIDLEKGLIAGVVSMV